MNVQHSIIKGIKALLYTNDYLVLPKFGGFVLKAQNAHFSASNGALLPPSKTVSFNVQLKQNDGVLVTWLQHELLCDHSEALSHITEFAEFCSSLLHSKRRLTIEEIGFFYLDFENNICFEPQQDVNFLTSSFGLSPITIKELAKETVKVEPKRDSHFVDRTVTAVEKEILTPKAKRNYKKVLLPLLAIVLLLATVSLVMTRVNVQGKLKSALFGHSQQLSYQPIDYPDFNLNTYKKENPAYVSNSEGLAVVELDDHTSLHVKLLSPDEGNRTSGIKTHLSSKRTLQPFTIVFGCFAVHANATRFAAKLSKDHLPVQVSEVNQKGMYVVSSQGYASKSEAQNELIRLKSQFPSAWIKHQP